MKQKRFFHMFAIFFLTAIILLLPLNYILDYHGVFRRYKAEPVVLDSINDRFVKMRYLLEEENFDKYNSYLWGSSRVMKMDTMVAREKTYNLGVQSGMTEDCLAQLQQLVSHGAQIDKIYIGLDDLSYIQTYEIVKNKINYKPYDDDFIGDMGTYIGYIFDPIAIGQVGRIIRIIRNDAKDSIRTYLHSSGMLLIPNSVEGEIEDSPGKYVLEKKFLQAKTYKKADNEFSSCLNNVSLIKQICDENGIQLFLFFNPQHMTTYLNDDMELMNRFKKELVKISPFWDFSGVNYVTANNYFWYETSHPRAFICDKILDTVSGQNQITWVPDFGVYVTEENVDAFCEKAVRDREAYDPNHEQWVPSAEERAVMTKRVNYPW